MEEEKLLSSKELAEYLKVKPATIYSWAKNGKIFPALTKGNRKFYRESDFENIKEPPIKKPLHKEKVTIPEPSPENLNLGFWNSSTKGNSKNLWLPSDINSLENTQIFKKSFPGRKCNLPRTSFCSLESKSILIKNPPSFSYQDFDFLESFPHEEEEKEKNYKTISFTAHFSYEEEKEIKKKRVELKKKIEGLRSLKDTLELKNLKDKFRNRRISLKEKIKEYFDQFRWYYNKTLEFLLFHEGGKFWKRRYTSFNIENLVRNCKIVRNEKGDLFLRLDEEKVLKSEENKKLKKESGKKKVEKRPFPFPSFWKTSPHNRIVRGAIEKFSEALNSCLSNKANGTIKTFKMQFLSRKSKNSILYFKDHDYPDFFKKELEGVFWYKGFEGKKKLLYSEFRKLFPKKGMEFLWEKAPNKYYFRVPVDMNWFPEDDRRLGLKVTPTGKTIALDPGVRKFQVGYSPSGEILVAGQGANEDLLNSMKRIDKLKKPKTKKVRIERRKKKMWTKITGKVSDLHWKTANYLVKNYDTILLPIFQTSKMVKKDGILRKKTRREMSMLSFYKFKQKLIYQCKKYGKKLLIVDESYTSKTCTNCGNMKVLGGNETYNCEVCGITLDRDVNGSRNIFLKNLKKVL